LARYTRESSDKPMLNAFWRVAPTVRLSALAILLAAVFFFAKAFNSRTCAALQETLFRAFFDIVEISNLKERSLIAVSQSKIKLTGALI
jgi:hypothetical protein